MEFDSSLDIDICIQRGALFKTLLLVVKEFVKHPVFVFTAKGIHFHESDTVNRVTTDVMIPSDGKRKGFIYYRCNPVAGQEHTSVSVSSVELFNLLRKVDKGSHLLWNKHQGSLVNEFTYFCEKSQEISKKMLYHGAPLPHRLAYVQQPDDVLAMSTHGYTHVLTVPADIFQYKLQEVSLFNKTTAYLTIENRSLFIHSYQIQGVGGCELTGTIPADAQAATAARVDQSAATLIPTTLQQGKKRKQFDSKKQTERPNTAQNLPLLQLPFAVKYLVFFSKAESMAKRVTIAMSADKGLMCLYSTLLGDAVLKFTLGTQGNPSIQTISAYGPLSGV